jgi:hypothetical protein
MVCLKARKLDLEARAALNEAEFRRSIRMAYMDRSDARWDDENSTFVEQAVAEAEMRSTEARYALDQHLARCSMCFGRSRN